MDCTTKKTSCTSEKFGKKPIRTIFSWHETSENIGASAKTSIQVKMGDEKLERFMAGNVQ
jgi:hypothetical protein